MKKLFANFLFIYAIAVFGTGKALAQVECNFTGETIFVSSGTIFHVDAESTAAEIIFVSKNTKISEIKSLVGAVVIHEKNKLQDKPKTFAKKKIAPQTSNIIASKVNRTIPLSENNQGDKIIVGSSALSSSPTSHKTQALVFDLICDTAFSDIHSYGTFRRKTFVFLDIKKISRNALFARPPTFS